MKDDYGGVAGTVPPSAEDIFLFFWIAAIVAATLGLAYLAVS